MGNRSAVINVMVTGDAAPLKKSFDDGIQASDEFTKATKDLEKQLDKVGKGVDSASRDIDGATKGMGRFADGFDGVRDSADDSERRITGFRDSLTGTQDVMGGLRNGDMVQLSTGFADLASSVANLGADMLEWGKKAWTGAKDVVAAHGATAVAKAKDIAASAAQKVATIATTVATGAQTAAQWLLNAAMEANPIMLVVLGLAALVAAFVIAWKNSETFRDIVTGAFDAVKGFAVDTFDWIKDNWPLLLAILTGPIGIAVWEIAKHWDTIKAGAQEAFEFITSLPGKIGDAASGLFDGMKEAFRGAINFIIRGWNKLKFTIPGWDAKKIAGQTVIPGWDGFTVGVPSITPLAKGGIVMQPTLALVGEAGPEAVVPLSRRSGNSLGGGVTIHINAPVYGVNDLDRMIRDSLSRARRSNG